MPRPSLLFLGHTYPFPPDGGVWARSYNVLRLLAQAYDVHAVFFERMIKTAPSADVASRRIEELATAEVVPVPQLHSRMRFVWDHVRSLLTRTVYTEFLFDSRRYSDRIRQLLAERDFALVHADSIDLTGVLREVAPLPIVCVHHNVESELLARRAAGERRAAMRAYLGYQARRMREAEQAWCPRVALNVVVSERDAQTLSSFTRGGRFAVVPNGVDTTYFAPGPDAPGSGVVFCGGTNWFPNKDALDWFASAVLPHVRAADPAVEVRWVGVASPADQASYRSQYGVELTGWVPDIRPHVGSAACFVVPIRVGGGSRLKILDAWAMGKAVVSTSVGCEGLHAVAGENILIADSPEEFANAVSRVLADTDLRRRLGSAGRRTAESEYSWRVIGERMIPLYQELAR